MINNPFFLDLYISMGHARIVEVIPVYEERNDFFLPTSNFRLYAGYFPDNELPCPDTNALLEKYFDNLDLMGDDSPGFLGEIKFPGFAHFEWQYLGNSLKEEEVLQVIGYIQNGMSPIRY